MPFFFATGTCSYDGTAAFFPVPEGVFDATATSRTTAGTGRQHTLRTQTVFNDSAGRPRRAGPPFLHVGQLSRGGTARQPVSVPSGTRPRQSQSLAQGPPSPLTGSRQRRHPLFSKTPLITKLRTRQPPYLDIPLVDTHAAGELGETGVDGWIDTHFRERFGGALLVGMNWCMGIQQCWSERP